MVCKIVVDAHSLDFTTQFKPPLDAFETRQRRLDHVIANTEFLRHDDRAKSVLHIEGAGHWNRELTDERFRTNNIKCHPIVHCLYPYSLPFAYSNPNGRHTRERRRNELTNDWAVHAGNNQT